MQKILPFLVGILICVASAAQDLTKFKLYAPADNAEQEIAKTVAQAKAEGKHVFIQVGGNWCIWCARFNEVVTGDTQIDSAVKAAYVVYHMNYSKENYNAKLLAKYGYPQRFGFPVFLILNSDGDLIHVQNSAYLEDGKKSYDHERVLGFFNDWSPTAMDPNQFKEK